MNKASTRQPAVHSRCDRWHRVSLFVLGAIAASVFFTDLAAHADGENPAEILAKTWDIYCKASAYTATAETVQVQLLGKTNIVRKYSQKVSFKLPGLLRVTSTYIGEGIWHRVTSGQQVTEIVNGTTELFYVPSMNFFAKTTSATPLESPVSPKVMGFALLPKATDPELSVMSHETINGRDAVIILHGDVTNFPRHCWRVYIDSQNYTLLQSQNLQQGSATQGTITTTTYTNQRFNADATVHDRLFTMKPPDMTPLAELLKKGRVTFSDHLLSPIPSPLSKYVLSPDGSITHFVGDIGKKGTFELEGNRLLITMDGIVQVWTLEPNGVAMHAPAALGGAASVFARD